MRKIIIALGCLILIIALSMWLDWPFVSQKTAVAPEKVYRNVLKRQPAEVSALNWQLALPEEQPKKQKEFQSDTLRVAPAKSGGFGFSLCSDNGTPRPDSLAQKFSAQKAVREGIHSLPVDCGMIKTSIPFSF